VNSALVVDVHRDFVDTLSLIISGAAAAGTIAAVWFAVVVAGRDRRERRKGQAETISAWPSTSEPGLPAGSDTVVLHNGSASAVYDILIAYAGAWGHRAPDRAAGTTKWLTMLPPGTWYLGGLPYEGEAMDYRSGFLLEFTDASGLRWQRTARGVLLRASSAWFDETQGATKPENRSLTRLMRT
jgi:hypothetical protein